MWPVTFEERLQQWCQLREVIHDKNLEIQLMEINNWWFRAPMVNRSLRWDNCVSWPDPWDLLAQDGWCDLARALGIMYTVMLVTPEVDVSMAMVGDDNLVLVQQGKYILNWCPGEVLNNHSADIKITRHLGKDEIQKKLG